MHQEGRQIILPSLGTVTVLTTVVKSLMMAHATERILASPGSVQKGGAREGGAWDRKEVPNSDEYVGDESLGARNTSLVIQEHPC